MTLGEKISVLRSRQNLSQVDLAEKMNVSRQSVSKWETDASIPELDKLLQLSELFNVTLDELVKSDVVQDSGTPKAPHSVESTISTRKIIGCVLLCFGALVLILLSILGGFISGVLFSSPFLLCGIVCLVFKKNIGLWCAWSVFFSVDMYMRFATGITWRLTLFTFNYDASMNYIRLAIAWIELISFISMSAITILRFSKTPLVFNKHNLILYAIGLCVFILLFIPVSLEAFPKFANTFFTLREWLRVALFITLSSATLRLFKQKRV